MKYTIHKIQKIDQISEIYSNFIINSPQKNIFCSKEILTFFFDDLDIYTINKNDKIKSCIYLFKDKNNSIISEPFIYSGILNHNNSEMKNARYNNELFRINDLIVNKIFCRYSNININLPINFLDARPFLWFNYGDKIKKKFLVTPRYTSLIHIHSKTKQEIFENIDDVKKRDIKNAMNDKRYNVSKELNLELIKNFYIQTMKKNDGKFNKHSLNKMFEFLKIQKKNKVTQVTTYIDTTPLYSVVFLNDENSSCYLLGSGNIEIKNRYAGSLALWKAIENSIENKIKIIDLEGINSPFRGEYKLNFGGDIVEYLNLIF